MSMRYVWRIQGKSLIHNRVRPMFAGYGRLVGDWEVDFWVARYSLSGFLSCETKLLTRHFRTYRMLNCAFSARRFNGGFNMRSYLKALIVPLVAGATIAQTSVPVEQEPHHHIVWKNGFVEVIRVALPVGESTLFHTHSRDRVAVDLTSTMLSFQKLNEPEGKPEPSIPGDISSHADFDAPYTHRLHNVGEKTYEVIDVEFFKRPEHPSEIAAATVVAENPSARVYKWK